MSQPPKLPEGIEKHLANLERLAGEVGALCARNLRREIAAAILEAELTHCEEASQADWLIARAAAIREGRDA